MRPIAGFSTGCNSIIDDCVPIRLVFCTISRTDGQTINVNGILIILHVNLKETNYAWT